MVKVIDEDYTAKLQKALILAWLPMLQAWLFAQASNELEEAACCFLTRRDGKHADHY